MTLGQSWDTTDMRRRQFDDLARHLVSDKLGYLISRYPTLSLTSIADQIADQQGVTFHRKYFTRLKKNKLNDAAVQNIIKWIDQYDPTFSASLIELSRSEAPFSFRSLSYSQGTWLPIASDERQLLREACERVAIPLDWRKTAAHYRPLNFFRDAYGIRVTDFSMSPPTEVFFVGRSSELHVIPDTNAGLEKLLHWAESQISHANVIDFVLFYFQALEADERPRFCLSLDDIDHPSRHRGFLSHTSTNEALVAAFEAPSVEAYSEHFVVRVDCVIQSKYHRLAVSVQKNGALEIIKKQAIHVDLGFEDVKAAATCIEILEPHPAQIATPDIHNQADILIRSKTGRQLLSLLEHKHIGIVGMRSHTSGFTYQPAKKQIIFWMSLRSKKSAIHLALELAHALRFADQHLLGITGPEGASTPEELATAMHVKELDAIVWICRIAAELRQSEHYEEAENYIRGAGYRHIYEAVVSDASPEQLFDAYVKS